jgi:tRNA (pseudouridine54-N1)-methyltransferase
VFDLGVVRSFVIIGEKASANGDFLLDDVPGTSGRMDVLLRCLRAGLLSSHGVRADTRMYLVLRQGPRIVRVDGETVQFLRPDERAMAVLMRKVLASDADESASDFVEVKPGICLMPGDIDVVLDHAKKRSAKIFVLDEDAEADIRDLPNSDLAGSGETMFVLGDHVGFSKDCKLALAKHQPKVRFVRLGPVSIHSDDAVAVVTNELDRRQQGSKLKES